VKKGGRTDKLRFKVEICSSHFVQSNRPGLQRAGADTKDSLDEEPSSDCAVSSSVNREGTSLCFAFSPEKKNVAL